MDLTNCLRVTTNRQFKSWMYYLDSLWNSPDLVCHYLMQIACEVRRVLSKNPNAVKDEHFKLKFTREDEKQEIPPEVRMQQSKAAWFAAAVNPFNRKKR